MRILGNINQNKISTDLLNIFDIKMSQIAVLTLDIRA